MAEVHDAPYDEIVEAVAARLDMTVEKVLDAYMEKSKERSLKRYEERRKSQQNNHIYQQLH